MEIAICFSYSQLDGSRRGLVIAAYRTRGKGVVVATTTPLDATLALEAMFDFGAGLCLWPP